jgi:hypothetical protein
MPSYVMQVKVGEEWKDIRPSYETSPPYRYKTQQAAVRMLEICYPDQCREQRLSGVHPPYVEGALVRVMESSEEPNQDWEPNRARETAW